ncbi:MAG: cyclic nucleotide-binding domain-containing protein [Mariprofundaceae bacterium]|nr:cyclic nucleotide-binding domain-containing protein [Mariprofundaceae bacterium]
MADALPCLMRQARQCVMSKSYEEAIKTYRDVLKYEVMKDSVDVHLRLAWCYEKLEVWDNACDMYERSMRLYQVQNEMRSAQELAHKVQSMRDFMVKRKGISSNESMTFPRLLSKLKDMGTAFSMQEGDVLCEAGEPSNMLWLLESGKLGVQLPDYLQDDEDELYARDGSSVLVGELGLFTRQRRSAKVWAKQTCHIYQISFSSIDACDDLMFKVAMQTLLKHYWMYPILSKHAIFERMNDVDRRALCDLFVAREMPSGECLIDYGEDHDGAYLLQQGCLFFIYESETGEQQVSSLFPGDMVHLGGLLHTYHANYEVRTATKVRLLHLSRQHVEVFIKNRPWMVDSLLRYSRRAAWRQIMRPDDAYLWMTNREIKQRSVSL